MCLLSLVQGNDEIDQLIIEKVPKASEFHKKIRLIQQFEKKGFSTTCQKVKEIIGKYPTCSMYNSTPLTSGNNPKGTQIMNFCKWMCYQSLEN